VRRLALDDSNDVTSSSPPVAPSACSTDGRGRKCGAICIATDGILQSNGEMYSAELQALTVQTEGPDQTWAAAAVACSLRSAAHAWPS